MKAPSVPSSAVLIARADWTKAELYPFIHFSDSTGWAWEFLRRSAHNGRDYQQSTARSSIDRRNEYFRLKWEINQLINLDTLFYQLPSSFDFLANMVEVFDPLFSAADLERRCALTGAPMVWAEQEVAVSDNQITKF